MYTLKHMHVWIYMRRGSFQKLIFFSKSLVVSYISIKSSFLKQLLNLLEKLSRKLDAILSVIFFKLEVLVIY